MKFSTKTKLKRSGLFVLAMIPLAVIGGYCAELYMLSAMDEATKSQLVTQFGSLEKLLVVGIVQVTLYAVITGGLGSYIAQKVGLWKSFGLDKHALLLMLALSVLGGVVLGFDPWVSSHFVADGVMDATNEARQTGIYLITGLLYGGVVEELFMRVFLMSLFALILWKIFWHKQEQAPVKAFVAANIVTALLFAMGHLPANYSLFGGLTIYIVIRCFVLNGCYGLIFGWLYRTFGIQYAMLCHAGCHLFEWILLSILL